MKNSQKGFAIPIIIAVVALLMVGGGAYIYTNNKVEAPANIVDITSNVSTTTPDNIVGGDKDAHGCIGSAGYSWCEMKNKCLRVWEEKCEVDSAIGNATSSDTSDSQLDVQKTVTPIQVQNLSTTDCKTDIVCFVNSISKNILTKVEYTVTVDIFGMMKQTSTNYMEIKKYDGDNLIFYIKNVENSAIYSSSTPQEVITSGQEVYKALKGRDGTCNPKKEDLLTLLSNWEIGSFSTNDWDGKKCEGLYFEPILTNY
jgi:hypothetical protein